MRPGVEARLRQVYLLQRTPGRFGRSLGKTTGWAHRASLKARSVETWAVWNTSAIDDAGLHIRVHGEPRLLEVDNVVICAGQVSRHELLDRIVGTGDAPHRRRAPGRGTGRQTGHRRRDPPRRTPLVTGYMESPVPV